MSFSVCSALYIFQFNAEKTKLCRIEINLKYTAY